MSKYDFDLLVAAERDLQNQFTELASVGEGDFRRRLIKIAALAKAAFESSMEAGNLPATHLKEIPSE